MRFILLLILKGIALIISLSLAAVVAAGVWFLTQDPNDLKPELEALILEQSGVQVAINGNLSWQLLPPLTLTAENLVVTDDDTQTNAESLHLNVDISAMWENVDQWKVSELHLVNTTITTPSGATKLASFDLWDFRPHEPARFEVVGSHLSSSEGATEVSGGMKGVVTYSPATAERPERFVIADARVTSDLAEGVCQIDLSRLDSPVKPPPPEHPDDLLPLATLLSHDLIADCDMDRLTVGSETFQQASVRTTNTAGRHNTYLEIKDFLGGSLITEVDINLTETPIRWTVLPEMDQVDSKRLIEWRNSNVNWIANFALATDMELRGNTRTALANSVKASSEFNGGQGEIDISAIKQQLAQLATLTRRTDEVANWPDMWAYEEFVGNWRVNGKNQELELKLDNMLIEADGTLDWLTDEVDLLANVTFSEPREGSPYRVNPLIQDTPLPMRCRGTAADMKCRLDSDATQRLIARALRQDDDSGLRRKLEEKIDEEVPEEYRDAARGLLDLLGRALDGG